jgi:hypothetical protein
LKPKKGSDGASFGGLCFKNVKIFTENQCVAMGGIKINAKSLGCLVVLLLLLQPNL